MRAAPQDEWLLELNPDTMPRVLVNQRFYARVAPRAEKEARTFLAERLANANWLVRSLQQRAQTILKVAPEIIRQQDGFLRHGVEHLKPLILRDIAEAVEMHESTVSRVTSNKYIATPRGTFELKYFFTTAIHGTDGGESHSAEAVRHRHPCPDRRRKSRRYPVGRCDRGSSATRGRGHCPPDRGQIPGGAAHPQLGAAPAGEGGAGLRAAPRLRIR